MGKKKKHTFLKLQLHLRAHNLVLTRPGVDRAVERKAGFIPLAVGHGQVDVQLLREEGDVRARLINLLGEDGHNHVRVGLVEVVAAGDELLLVGGLGRADEQVPVGGAAGEFEKLVEFEDAPLAAGVAL